MELRRRTAIGARVDFIATDHCERLDRARRERRAYRFVRRATLAASLLDAYVELLMPHRSLSLCAQLRREKQRSANEAER